MGQGSEDVQMLHSIWWTAERERRIMVDHLRRYDGEWSNPYLKALGETYRNAAVEHLKQVEGIARLAWKRYEAALSHLQTAHPAGTDAPQRMLRAS
jgi:hypothetical protein